MSLTLITGGARSGKSTFAQQQASNHAGSVVFVATAEPHDDEMAERIAKHRAERPSHWHTLEVPRNVAQALTNAPAASLVLLDCVTLWVTNILLQEGATWDDAEAELHALLMWYHTHTTDLIIVTNEVGLGIVPANALSRTFRDWLGLFNQRLAANADVVYLLVAGLPINITALAQPSRPEIP